VAGLALKVLTGARLIVDIPGDPRTAFLADSPSPSLGANLKNWLTRQWSRFLLSHVDRLKLLFPHQADVLGAAELPQSIFSDFVAVSSIGRGIDGKYLLLLGYPWQLKGVDLLIRAFRAVADEFPGYRLKVVGHCPDRRPFELLREGDERIEFHPGVVYARALALIADCTCFVLPSRTEGMPRVLIEAMAAGKPILASRVGGIPFYIEDGQTGLLFDSEDEEQLAACLRRVLASETLRARLGEQGRAYVLSHLTERCYAEQYEAMLRRTLGP
jgi:glycosyltransferase involved in cell wall biosynthesis